MEGSQKPTLLRVKRLKTQPPSSVLVLSARKRKASVSSADLETDLGDIKILKLAATLPAKEDSLGDTVTKILEEKRNSSAHTFEELKERYKKSISAKSSPLDQAKVDVKDARQDKRFRLVSQKRAIKINELEEWPETVDIKESDSHSTSRDPIYHLYDVVSEDLVKDKPNKPSANEERISCNGVEMVREFVDAQKSETDYSYVYDLYFTGGKDGEEQGDFDDRLLDGLVSIQPFNTGEDLCYDVYRDHEFKYEDDVDSNEEDNERNEYPDEEEEESSYMGYGEDDFDLDMRVRGLGLGSDEERSDLSSDEEDQLLYTRSFEDDAACHGSAYARFKQKMVREFYQSKDDEDDIDDDDGEYVDDD